jgi:hypothetical protein
MGTSTVRSGVVRSGVVRGGVRGGVSVSLLVWGVNGVDGDTFVLNVSNVSVLMVSGISDNLGTTVGKGNTVFPRNNSVLILKKCELKS